MLTQQEVQLLFSRVETMLEPLKVEIQELKEQLETLNAKQKSGPKTSTSRSKRVQQAKADA